MRSWMGLFFVGILGCSAAPEASDDGDEAISIDPWCGPLRRLGRCAMPNLGCASPLGAAIAKDAWDASHGAGTVPSHLLYTSKNASFGSFVDSREVFPEMAKLIAAAKSEVLIETFDWDPSVYTFDDPRWQNDPTMILVDAMRKLEQRVKAEGSAPVRVWITVDGRAPLAPPYAGAPAVNKSRALFRQLASFGGLDPKAVELHVGAHERWGAGGLHSKTIVVDGYVAMVMGANPQQWQTIGMNWHDSGYGVLGEAGVAMAKNIDDTWKESTEVLSCDLSKDGGDARCTTRPAQPIAHANLPSMDADPRLAGACMPVFAATKRAVGSSLTSLTLSDTSSPQDRAFLAMFGHAKDTIKIESPNLNGRAAEETWKAATRGVSTRILLTYTFNSASERQQIGPVSGGGSNEDVIRTLHQRMKKDPSACGHLDMRFISKDGVRPLSQVEPGASHVKFMTVDGQVAMVGSANQDMSSWELTRETNFLVDDSKVVAEYDARVFDADWSHAVTVESFAKQVLANPSDPSLTTFLIDPKAWACDVITACSSDPRCP